MHESVLERYFKACIIAGFIFIKIAFFNTAQNDLIAHAIRLIFHEWTMLARQELAMYPLAREVVPSALNLRNCG